MSSKKKLLIFTTFILLLMSLMGFAVILIIFQPNFPELLGLTKVEEIEKPHVETARIDMEERVFDCFVTKIVDIEEDNEAEPVEVNEYIYIKSSHPTSINLKYESSRESSECHLVFEHMGAQLHITRTEEEYEIINLEENFIKVSPDGRIIRPIVTPQDLDQYKVDKEYSIDYFELHKTVEECENQPNDSIQWPCGSDILFSDYVGFTTSVKIPERRSYEDVEKILVTFDEILGNLKIEEYKVEDVNFLLDRPVSDIVLSGDNCENLYNAEDIKCVVKDANSDKELYVFTNQTNTSQRVTLGKSFGNRRYILVEESSVNYRKIFVFEFNFLDKFPNPIDIIEGNAAFIRSICGSNYDADECQDELILTEQTDTSVSILELTRAIDFLEAEIRYSGN